MFFWKVVCLLMLTGRRCVFVIVACLKAAVGKWWLGRLVFSCRLSIGTFPPVKNPCLMEVFLE